ncbi:hypothetical protein B0H13DRAFT_1886344 [Mycena leptocephala]|nr:hypothetical protein B0H13DRAFT_1886344 [Mycena leptocephala]
MHARPPIGPPSIHVTTTHNREFKFLNVGRDSATIWASRALISAAGLFLFDFALTFTSEIDLYRHSGQDRKLLWSFLALRYFPAFYQFLMLFAIIYNNPTISLLSCSALDRAALALDTAFQLSYIGLFLDYRNGNLRISLGIISWRVKVISGNFVAVPLAILGLLTPIINIAVSNPSVFPQCRLLDMTPPARIVTILPCLRAVFDAATTLALFVKLFQHIQSMGALASNTVSFVLTEEIKDIMQVHPAVGPFVHLTSSAQIDIRNYDDGSRVFSDSIIPFVDSLTALLATRFMLELEEKGRDRKRSRPVSDGYLPSTGPTLVASEAPTSALRGDDSASSLNVHPLLLKPGDHEYRGPLSKPAQEEQFAMFLALRNLPALYQVGIVLAVFDNDWTPAVAIPLAVPGFLSPVINVAVSNPSTFAQCRLLSSAPTARVPGFRSETVEFLITEGGNSTLLAGDSIAIAQISSARIQARNFIVPFVDSLAAILAMRFILEMDERSNEAGKLSTGMPFRGEVGSSGQNNPCIYPIHGRSPEVRTQKCLRVPWMVRRRLSNSGFDCETTVVQDQDDHAGVKQARLFGPGWLSL